MDKKLSSGSGKGGRFGKGEGKRPSDRKDDNRSGEGSGKFTSRRETGEGRNPRGEEKPFRPGWRKPPREEGGNYRSDRKSAPREKSEGDEPRAERPEKKFNMRKFEESRGPMERPAPRKPKPGTHDEEDFKAKKPYGKREGGFRGEDGDRPPRKPRTTDERGEGRSFGDRKPFGKRNDSDFKSGKPYEKRADGFRSGDSDRPAPRRKFEGDRESNDRNEAARRPRRDFSSDGDFKSKKPYEKREGGFRGGDSDRPALRRKFEGDREPGERPSGPRKPRTGDDRESRSFGDKKPFGKRNDDRSEKPFARKRFEDKDGGGDFDKPKRSVKNAGGDRKPFAGMPKGRKSREDFKRDTYADAPEFKPRKAKTKPEIEDEAEYYGDNDEWAVSGDKRSKRPAAATYPMPLNKYIAHSGECSRRDAAELVKQGKAKVNGELITDPGHKINEGDLVTLSGKKLKPQKGLAYILLNKPKGFITTSEDERGRRTVMDLVDNAEVGRVYPVGRLDRATTGLLLLTNDGALAQKLSHPSHNVKKVYHVTLDKPLSKADFEKIVEGVELEDGKAVVDEIAYLEKKNELGLEIHSGKNRIVRRIFESLGYVVDKLDRMMYAGLTKKNLPRGKWRFLDEREIVLLKHFKS